MAKIAALAALLIAGILLGVGLGTGGAQLVTTETTTTTVPTTTTAPGTTLVTTVQQTTTRRVPVPATTTSGSSSTDNVPTWVWVVLGILAVAVIGLVIALAMRGGGGGGGGAVPPAERRRRLDGAVATWAAQGWALENQTGDSAVLRRGGDAMVISVDPAGQISTRPLSGPG